ncbi:MAG: DUF4349 domain-containing protein [Flavobacteriales bacterium]
MKNLILPLLLFAAFVSCESDYSENSSNLSYSEEDESKEILKDEVAQGTFKKGLAKPSGNFVPNTPIKISNRKIIWKGDMKFQVKEVTQSSEEIGEIAKELGGLISDMNMTSSNYRISNTLTIRIANDKFHELIKRVKGESIFTDYANVNSNDVTAEFVDIESRLKTKREVRDRYINILRNKTGKIKDVIAAEEAIRVITEEIEAKEGRLRYLKDKVDFSTVKIELYQKVDYQREPEISQETPFSEKLGNSFGNGWSAIKGIFLFLITIWPLILLGIAVLVFFRRRRKKD